jgi:hypothetical protein
MITASSPMSQRITLSANAKALVEWAGNLL